MMTGVLLFDISSVWIDVLKLEIVSTSWSVVPDFNAEGLSCVVGLQKDFLDSVDMIDWPEISGIWNLDAQRNMVTSTVLSMPDFHVIVVILYESDVSWDLLIPSVEFLEVDRGWTFGYLSWIVSALSRNPRGSRINF